MEKSDYSGFCPDMRAVLFAFMPCGSSLSGQTLHWMGKKNGVCRSLEPTDKSLNMF